MSNASHSLETRILRGVGWIALGFGARQIITWASMLILVRLVDPRAFGTVSLALAIVTAFQYLRGSGIWAALVYRRDDVEEAAASALLYMIVSNVAVYGLLFGAAPFFAGWFHSDGLTAVTRVMALVIPFAGLSVVPGALLERELRYAAGSRVDLGGAFAQLVLSVGLALAGAGVWSLVAGQVAAAAAETVLLWWLVPWRPRLRAASVRMLRELFTYGRFAGLGNIASFLIGTVDNLAVGRLLGSRALGFYSVAFRVATVSESVFSYVIVKAMFPAFAMVKDDPVLFRRTFVQHAQRLALLVLPVTVFLALAAKPVVLALLGPAWSVTIAPLRLLAVFGLLTAISATTSAVFRGAGRPDLGLWFAGADVLLLVPLLVLLIERSGLKGAAFAQLLSMTLTVVPACAFMLRLIELSWRDLATVLGPSLSCSALLAATVGPLASITGSLQPLTALAVVLAGGIIAYVVATAVFARGVVVGMWIDLRGAT